MRGTEGFSQVDDVLDKQPPMPTVNGWSHESGAPVGAAGTLVLSRWSTRARR